MTWHSQPYCHGLIQQCLVAYSEQKGSSAATALSATIEGPLLTSLMGKVPYMNANSLKNFGLEKSNKE